MHLPVVVNVDVDPTVIDEAAVDHRVGGGFDPFLRHRVGETVPTVPAHRRRQTDLRTANNLQFPFGVAQFVFGLERHHIFTFLVQLASDPTGLRIQL